MPRKMKDSGIEWIGEIPEGWAVGKTKLCYEIILGKMLQPQKEYEDDELLDYMCSVNITWAGIDLSTQKQMWFSPREKAKYLLRPSDLLVAEGGDVGVSCIWNNEIPNCCIQNALHLVRSKDKNLNKYLYYWIFTLKHIGYFDLICNKATLAHFTKDKFEKMPICLIPFIEQRAIVAFLDEQCAKIDKLLSIFGVTGESSKSNEYGLIAKLTEYKKSLIYEAVTGKMEV